MNTKSAVNSVHDQIYTVISSVISISEIKSIALKFNARMKLMEEVRAERKQLASMSPEMLGDIGIDVGAANQEAARRYFDLPQGRW